MVRTRVIPLAEQLLDTLGEQGYRSTSPRKAVTQAIAGKQGHFTAEQLRQSRLQVVPGDSRREGLGHPSSVFGDGIDHDPRRGAQRSVVEVDAIIRNEKLTAHHGPERLVILLAPRPKVVRERLNRPRPGQRRSTEDREKIPAI